MKSDLEKHEAELHRRGTELVMLGATVERIAAFKAAVENYKRAKSLAEKTNSKN